MQAQCVILRPSQHPVLGLWQSSYWLSIRHLDVVLPDRVSQRCKKGSMLCLGRVVAIVIVQVSDPALELVGSNRTFNCI